MRCLVIARSKRVSMTTCQDDIPSPATRLDVSLREENSVHFCNLLCSSEKVDIELFRLKASTNNRVIHKSTLRLQRLSLKSEAYSNVLYFIPIFLVVTKIRNFALVLCIFRTSVLGAKHATSMLLFPSCFAVRFSVTVGVFITEELTLLPPWSQIVWILGGAELEHGTGSVKSSA
jgi:hypothetical protein